MNKMKNLLREGHHRYAFSYYLLFVGADIKEERRREVSDGLGKVALLSAPHSFPYGHLRSLRITNEMSEKEGRI